jgi:glutamyl-tRNA reductase
MGNKRRFNPKRRSFRERRAKMNRSIIPINEILDRVISEKGKDHQIDIAIEEMSELTKALLKDRRHHSPETVADITEEMADVYICLAELSIIYENRSEVEDMTDRKLQRLKERLDDEEMGNEGNS